MRVDPIVEIGKPVQTPVSPEQIALSVRRWVSPNSAPPFVLTPNRDHQHTRALSSRPNSIQVPGTRGKRFLFGAREKKGVQKISPKGGEGGGGGGGGVFCPYHSGPDASSR